MDFSNLPDFTRIANDIENDKMKKMANLIKGNDKEEYASAFFKRLISYVEKFDKNLDQEHEVGIRLVNFGQTIQFAVQNIGYYNPKLISFYGELEDGSKVQLVQHVNQISFLLLAVKRKHPDQPKRPIGFGREKEKPQPEGQACDQSAATTE